MIVAKDHSQDWSTLYAVFCYNTEKRKFLPAELIADKF